MSSLTTRYETSALARPFPHAMTYIFRGLSMILGDRTMWRYIIVPMLWSVLVYVSIVVGGYFLVVPLLEKWITQLGGGSIASAVGSVVYVLLWIFLSGVIFLSIAGIMSSLFWDGLSKRVEEKSLGSAKEMKHSPEIVFVDAVGRMFFSCFIATFSLLIGWCFFGIPGILMAGWLGLYDYTACAFLRRGVTFGKQMRLAFRCKGWLGFALGSGLITLFPIINVLMLPSLVAGGTLLCAETFRKGIHSE